MIRLIAVDLQFDFTRPEGKHYKPTRTSVDFIKRRILPHLKLRGKKIAEITSDYRQFRPGDRDHSCVPGTFGYKSEIPPTMVRNRWIKCMNSPYFTRENIGVEDKEPGLPVAKPDLFYEWLGRFCEIGDMVVLFGLTLDCCVLCTAQAIRFQGHDVRILTAGTDTYEGGVDSKERVMRSVVSNWARPISWVNLKQEIDRGY